MDFYYIFLKLCNSIDKSPSKVAVEIGSTRAAVSRWKNGSIPSDTTLLKLADYFGVSVQYLKGETENPSTGNGKGEGIEHFTVYTAEPEGTTRAHTYSVNSDIFNRITELIEIVKKLPKEKIQILTSTAKAMQPAVDSRININSAKATECPVRNMTIAAYGGGLTQHEITATDEEIQNAIDESDEDPYLL